MPQDRIVLPTIGYDGYLSIETHVRFAGNVPPPIAACRHNLTVLTRWLGDISA